MYRLIPVIISCLFLAAHFMRAEQTGLVALWVSALLLLLIKRSWIANTFSILLILGALIWGQTTHIIYKVRLSMGAPWLRMALILGGVAVFTAASALVFRTETMKNRYGLGEKSSVPGVAAFFLTAIALWAAQKLIFPQGILLDRIIKGGFWLVGFWLSVFAGYMADKMRDAKKSGDA